MSKKSNKNTLSMKDLKKAIVTKIFITKHYEYTERIGNYVSNETDRIIKKYMKKKGIKAKHIFDFSAKASDTGTGVVTLTYITPGVYKNHIKLVVNSKAEPKKAKRKSKSKYKAMKYNGAKKEMKRYGRKHDSLERMDQIVAAMEQDQMSSKHARSTNNTVIGARLDSINNKLDRLETKLANIDENSEKAYFNIVDAHTRIDELDSCQTRALGEISHKLGVVKNNVDLIEDAIVNEPDTRCGVNSDDFTKAICDVICRLDSIENKSKGFCDVLSGVDSNQTEVLEKTYNKVSVIKDNVDYIKGVITKFPAMPPVKKHKVLKAPTQEEISAKCAEATAIYAEAPTKRAESTALVETPADEKSE